MATTDEYSLSYPTGSDSAEIDVWARALSNDLERVFSENVQTGTTTVIGTGTDDASTQVFFSSSFPSVPSVVATVRFNTTAGDYLAAVGDVTTTSAYIRVGRRDNATFTGTVFVSWIALAN